MITYYNAIHFYFKGDYHDIPVFVYRIAFRQRMMHE